VHEAVHPSTSPDVGGPAVTAVLRRGYRFGDRVLRAAMVAVTDHEVPAEESPVEVNSQGVGAHGGESAEPAEQAGHVNGDTRQ
jgi:molecular chaperone GrpE